MYKRAQDIRLINQSKNGGTKLRVKTVGAGVDGTNLAAFFLTPNGANSSQASELKLDSAVGEFKEPVTHGTATHVARDHVVQELVDALLERNLKHRKLSTTDKFNLLRGCGKVHHHTAFMLLCTAHQLETQLDDKAGVHELIRTAYGCSARKLESMARSVQQYHRNPDDPHRFQFRTVLDRAIQAKYGYQPWWELFQCDLPTVEQGELGGDSTVSDAFNKKHIRKATVIESPMGGGKTHFLKNTVRPTLKPNKEMNIHTRQTLAKEWFDGDRENGLDVMWYKQQNEEAFQTDFDPRMTVHVL